MLNEEIIRLTETLTPWMIELRRTIHQNPELCNQEFATQALVIRELGAMGITEIKKYFNTGLAAVIRGSAPGKTIAIRADMDALSITEETQLPFSSANSGIMHACGHDGHTAILLGTARVLSQLKGNFKGNVKLIFQPAEENGPQGGGALPMIKEGVLTDEPAVDSIIGLHILPDFPVGTIAGKAGSAHAGSAPIYLDIIGTGGHASQPHLLKDPIVASAYIIAALQTVVSRNVNAFENAVVGISMIQGGTRHNIVPDRVHLRGTIRTFNPEVKDMVGNRITKIVENIAEAMDVRAELSIRWNYGPLVNSQEMFELSRSSVKDILGKKNFIDVKEPMSFGEDFSYFAEKVPAMYMWLGGKIEDGKERILHSSVYNFSEQAMWVGVKAMSKIAIDFLNSDLLMQSIYRG